MLKLLPAALATELLICPDSLSCKNFLSADPHILHGVTVDLQIGRQKEWKQMDGMSINRSWVTNCGAWSWALGKAIKFQNPSKGKELSRKKCLILILCSSFIQSLKCINQSAWAETTEIHNHSSLWHWWKLYWIKCIGILIMNLWFSELPLGHQYLVCNHILQAAEWLSGYALCWRRQSSQPAAERWSSSSTGRINL